MARRIRRARYGPTTVRQQNTQMSQYRAIRSGYVPPPELFPSIFLTDFNSTPKSITAAMGNNAVGLYVSPNGEDVYIADETTGNIYQYTFETPYDPSTILYTGNSHGMDVSRLFGMTMNPDGSKIYTLDITHETLEEFELTTPWDITSVNDTELVNFDTNPFTITGDANGLAWSSDGLYLYGIENTGMFQIPVTVPYDLSTRGTIVSVYLTGMGASDIQVSIDGTMIWVCWGTNPGAVRHFPMSTPHDLTTCPAVNASEDFTTDAGNNAPVAFYYFEERAELLFHDDNELRDYSE